ncbi:MAG TPA: carbon starvation CstA family protein, partial [Planctomycetaceae bacterium]
RQPRGALSRRLPFQVILSLAVKSVLPLARNDEMSLLTIVLISAACLLTAYFTYGPLLSRLLNLRADVPTPAVTLRDDVDYAPIDSKFLLSQHFSAIAAAGPIVGPILAGIAFGWLPALLWILIGSILIGGVHDMTSLTASIRHKARSIAEVVRDHMSRRSYLLFLAFVWLALVYIIVAFTDVTATSFLGELTLDDGSVATAVGTPEELNNPATLKPAVITGGGIATSSLLYLALPIVMGLLLKYTKLTVNWATVIFVPLVGVAIWVGQYIPFDIAKIWELSPASAQKAWNVTLVLYCVVASVLPMWLLLQPRGHLGGYFLYVALAGGMLGLMFGGRTIQYPAFTDWSVTGKGKELTLFPMLFITIACGACSGFHSIIASGTTSKQLKNETDARLIGYGSMLLEAMVAIVSLCCVMMLVKDDPNLKKGPNFLYARGIGDFLSVIRIAPAFGVAFGLMAFTTFVYDTLDVCTRLGRYILQELTGMQGRAGRWLATGLTAGVPLIFLIWQPVDAQGKVVERWRIFWDLFGASNQLLAALTLLGVTVWLFKTYRAKWVLVVTGLPCVFMYTMSMWALAQILWPLISAIQIRQFDFSGPLGSPVPWVALVLATLGLLILVEAVRVVLSGISGPPNQDTRALPAATA